MSNVNTQSYVESCVEILSYRSHTALWLYGFFRSEFSEFSDYLFQKCKQGLPPSPTPPPIMDRKQDDFILVRAECVRQRNKVAIKYRIFFNKNVTVSNVNFCISIFTPKSKKKGNLILSSLIIFFYVFRICTPKCDTIFLCILCKFRKMLMSYVHKNIVRGAPDMHLFKLIKFRILVPTISCYMYMKIQHAF